jgi:DHA1 family bicyclomycin/chloramphenicol resistance-like MFS transporter
VIIQFWGWHGIFAAFILFSVVSMIWLGLRLPETLPAENRRPMRLSLMLDAVGEMFANPTVRLSIIVQTLVMAMLFTLLMLIQPIYASVFDRAETFHLWFGVIALTSASASFMNAQLVVKFGMRRLVTVALAVQIVLSAAMLSVSGYMGPHSFTLFVIWQAFVFFHAGLTVGNLNAIAMEPMGHIAGMAASVIGAVSTVMAAGIASPIGMLFDGTIRPLVGAILILATIAFILMLLMAREEQRELA